MKLRSILIFCISVILANYTYAASSYTQFSFPLTYGDMDDPNNRTTLVDDHVRAKDGSLAYKFTIVQGVASKVQDGEYWNVSLWNTITDNKVRDLSSLVAETIFHPTLGNRVCLVQQNPASPNFEENAACFDPSLSENYTSQQHVDMNCEDTADYEIRVEYGTGPVENSHPFPFTLADYTAGEPVITGVEDITPLVAYNAQQLISISPAGWKYHAPTPAGIMNLGITVMDSGGCGIPFPDIPVTLTTELVSFSGSHLHFSAPEAGKGTFSTGTNTTTVITDPFGQATADYTAGVWGVDEELTATLTEPVTNEVKSVVENYSIKIDELRELSTNGPYILKGGKGTRTNCDITHNIDKSTRLGHYVTLFTKAKIWELNALYSSHTGNNLCVNDASLQNGGYFDNGAGGTCHGSHRQGIDVDINTEAELTCLENLKTEYVTYRGNSMTKAKALDRMAASIGGFKVIEDSLHYRFKK